MINDWMKGITFSRVFRIDRVNISHKMINNINDIIKMRYSPLIFSDKAVERTQVEELLNAARLSPSSFNEQPWRYVYALRQGNSEGWERLYTCLAEPNKAWAKSAPVLICAVAKARYSQTGKTNDHARYDLGQSVAYLTMKAMSVGLYMHQMGGFDPQMATELLSVPGGYEPVTMIALGYPGNTDRLGGELKKRAEAPNSRMSVEEIAYYNTWKK